MYSRRLYGTGSATANAIATVTVPRSSRLAAVQWAVKYDSVTDNAACVLELSVASASEIATNESQQCISELAWFNNLLTSGMFQGSQNLWLPVDVQLAQGQKIYLHSLVTATVTWIGGAILWFK